MTLTKMKLGASALAMSVVAAAAHAETIDMQAYVPSSLPVLGSAGLALGERVTRLTGGEIEIVYHNPGELAPTNEIWDGVSTGAITAGWYTPGLAEGIIPASPLFTAFPFGPDAVEYSAWWYNGGGKELWAELSAPYNIHSELCAMLAPEASGWFNNEINSPADLEGLKMRIFGLGASVMEKLGAQAQSMGVGDTMTGLNLGTLDAAEISFPAIDLMLGMQEHAKHYYFPGWHQQSSLITFIINKDVWDGLEDQQRAAIEEVCAANVTASIAEGESIQLEPLASLDSQGVTVHTWSDDMLSAFSGAWDEVVAERTASNADFKRVWEHIQAFRADYATWGDLAYVD
jgi:TRAP-type mannitol/chloroaromatic compound transport system substrate-binding protein